MQATCEFCYKGFTENRPNAGWSSRDYHAECWNFVFEPVTYGTYSFDWLESFLQLTWLESRPGATYSNALPAENYELALFGVIWI